MFLTILFTWPSDLNENGPCTIGNGKYVCSLIHNCDSIYRETRKPGFNFYSLHEKRCGFKKDMFLVCCPDRIFIPEESTPINLSPDDIKHTVFFNTPFGIGVRGKTGRADAACEKYSNDISNALYNHIAQGKPTKPDEFPHMAALIYDVPEAPWQCGGALISHRYVLTAAHCLNSRSGPPIKVILGTNDLTDTKTSTVVDVESNIKHPNYVNSRFYFDIGLVLLKEHIDFTTVLRPACLNTEPITIAPNSLLTVTGFGKIGSRPEDPQSSLLLQTDLNYIPLDACNYTYVTERPDERQLPYGLDPGQFCAQDKFTQDSSKQTDSCTGDSGGPLQIRGLKFGNTSVIFGVVSVGQPCPSSSPGIYTNVFYYLDWIESIVWPTPP